MGWKDGAGSLTGFIPAQQLGTRLQTQAGNVSMKDMNTTACAYLGAHSHGSTFKS